MSPVAVRREQRAIKRQLAAVKSGMSYADATPMPRYGEPLDPVLAALGGLENKLRAETKGGPGLASMWHDSAERAFAEVARRNAEPGKDECPERQD